MCALIDYLHLFVFYKAHCREEKREIVLRQSSRWKDLKIQSLKYWILSGFKHWSIALLANLQLFQPSSWLVWIIFYSCRLFSLFLPSCLSSPYYFNLHLSFSFFVLLIYFLSPSFFICILSLSLLFLVATNSHSLLFFFVFLLLSFLVFACFLFPFGFFSWLFLTFSICFFFSCFLYLLVFSYFLFLFCFPSLSLPL